MAEPESRNTWKPAFFILLAVTVVLLLDALLAEHQLYTAKSQLDQANTQLSAFNSSNAQNQRACIDNAQKLFAAEAADPYILSGAASTLSAQTSACQAEYPTH